MTKNEWMNIGRTIKKQRESKGIKQKFIKENVCKRIVNLEKATGHTSKMTMQNLRNVCDYIGLDYGGNIENWDELENIQYEFWIRRKSKNLTVKELSKLSGLSSLTITKLENGSQMPTIRDLTVLNEPLELGLWED